MTDRNCDDGLALTPEPATIRDEQVERAVERLAERGELTPRQRAAIERLADRLTAELQESFEVEAEEEGGADETTGTAENPPSGDGVRQIPLCPD